MKRVSYTVCSVWPGLSFAPRGPEVTTVPRAAALPPLSISAFGVYNSPVDLSYSATPAKAGKDGTATLAKAIAWIVRLLERFIVSDFDSTHIIWLFRSSSFGDAQNLVIDRGFRLVFFVEVFSDAVSDEYLLPKELKQA